MRSCPIRILLDRSSVIGAGRRFDSFGVELTNRQSLEANLRSSKFQGQSNFVNPGIHLFNLGLDADITPRLKTINNVNFLWFDQTEVLETYLFVGDVRNFIGTDISTGLEYRPLLNNNILLLGGLATLISGEGFEDLYQTLQGETRQSRRWIPRAGSGVLNRSERNFADPGGSVGHLSCSWMES